LACPFFSPVHRVDNIALPHPERLPLGAAWHGSCAAPGQADALLSNEELQECNVGYAKKCPRLPKERSADAIRFGVSSDSGEAISVQFVVESQYLPVAHGLLQYDPREKKWTSEHPEPLAQKLAEAFLQSYVERRSPVPNSRAEQ
jgi:hypothetical protein